jgi:uncharacterized membrane protein YdfJ with MMPL/SSD domain
LWVWGWPLVAAAVWIPAPRIPTLLADHSQGFLPADMPSQRALTRLREEFPDSAPASRAVVVFGRTSGLTPEDESVVDQTARALEAAAAERSWRVQAPSLSPHLRPLLVSRDQAAALIAVNLPAEMLTHNTVNRVREIRRIVMGITHPAGLEAEITGSAALGELLDANTKRHIEQSEFWAFIAVTLILLFIYRSPVAMFLPLATVTLSIMIALGTVGWAASFGLPVNGLVELFIVVLLGGMGVDYCLFLFSRYREEMTTTPEVAGSIEKGLAHTGGAILAGAGTIVVGLATLYFAGNRDLYTSGPTIAFAVCVVTFAALTLTPSLMRLAGKRLMWPGKVHNGNAKESRLWDHAARAATRHPVIVFVILFAAMSGPAWLAFRAEPLYDAFEEYPSEASYVRGARLYYKHFFDADRACEMTFVVTLDRWVDGPSVAATLDDALDRLHEELAGQYPLAYQRDLRDPLGTQRSEGTSATPPSRGRLASEIMRRASRPYYFGQSGTSVRVDVGLRLDPRSVDTLAAVGRLRDTAAETFRQSGLLEAAGASGVEVDIAGETAVYADIRALRRQDFRLIAVLAPVLIGLILWKLTRSILQAFILVGATWLTYLATYGITWLIFRLGYGLAGLNFHVDLLLFIIIMSLGQDYNIFVITRFQEECRTQPPREAMARAILRTGRVVSSCGVIMAATFGSMAAGSVMVMKEMAVALAMGILMDTFLIRPMLVPALVLLAVRHRMALWRGRERGSTSLPLVRIRPASAVDDPPASLTGGKGVL